MASEINEGQEGTLWSSEMAETSDETLLQKRVSMRSRGSEEASFKE